MTTPLVRWRGMTLAERERAYSPSSCLLEGDYRPFIEEGRRIGRHGWAALEAAPSVHTTTLSYGNDPSQTVDLAVPVTDETAVPLVAYIHGGYWQELSKLDAHFAAWDCVQRGWAYAAIDYTLAPAADLPAIVEECREAARMLHRGAAEFGVAAERTFVAGSSAGAHLAAMVAVDPDGPVQALGGVILLSGIFELEPLIDTSINDALALDPAAARQLSPLLADLEAFPLTLLAYGDNETEEFKAQSHAFAHRLRKAGRTATVLEIAGRNHFDVILDLATPTTSLGDAVADLIESRGGTHADL